MHFLNIFLYHSNILSFFYDYVKGIKISNLAKEKRKYNNL